MTTTINDYYGLGKPNNLLNPEEFIIGIECEIESVRHWNIEGTPIQVKEDGSLRNSGYEFITKPQTKDFTLVAFWALHSGLKFYDRDLAFSERTSTHVHVNCSALSVEQTRVLVLLYALYEEYFFQLVKPERRDNIHCVPLSETYLSSKYAKPIYDMLPKWSKYTALNILPLKTLGTVEFRHLHGTGDENELSSWLTCLENLYKISRSAYISRETLGNKEWIYEYFQLIFGHTNRRHESLSNVQAVVSNSLIDLKLAV